MVTSRLARLLPAIAATGIAVAVLTAVIGHLGLGPGYDPVALTVSDFALSDRGGAVEVAMVTLGVAGLALVGGMVAVRAPVRGAPAALLGVFGVGLLVAAAVPTDPVGIPMTVSGYVHRFASVAAFASLPAAAFLLAPRLRADRRWWAVATRVRGLAAASTVGLLVMWYVAFPGHRVMIGLAERGLLAVEVALLAVLTLGLHRAVAVRSGAGRTSR